MPATTVSEKGGMDLKRSGGGVKGRVQREGKEGRNVIELESQKITSRNVKPISYNCTK